MKNILNNRVVKKYNIKQIVTIDLGKNMAFYYDPNKSDKTFKITHQELLDLPNKYENTLFVSEGAHMDRPRTMKSHACDFIVLGLSMWAPSETNRVFSYLLGKSNSS